MAYAFQVSSLLLVALHSQCCAVLYAMSHSGPLALLFLRNVIDSSLPALHVSKLLPTLPGPLPGPSVLMT